MTNRLMRGVRQRIDSADPIEELNSAPLRYIVVREWATPSGRTYRMGLGIYESRGPAVTRCKAAERSALVSGRFYVVPFRTLV